MTDQTLIAAEARVAAARVSLSADVAALKEHIQPTAVRDRLVGKVASVGRTALVAGRSVVETRRWTVAGAVAFIAIVSLRGPLVRLVSPHKRQTDTVPRTNLGRNRKAQS